MLPRTKWARTNQRQGAVLLVVLTLLALFAVIGLSFVLYAESEATAARIAKDAINTDTKKPDPIIAVNETLGQILYPNASERSGSGLFGYDFARMVYGRAHTGADISDVPYNGHGIYEERFNLPWLGLPAAGPNPLFRSQVVRFGSYQPDPTIPTFGVYIDPDHVYGDGFLQNPAAPDTSRPQFAPFYVGRNAPYTYPDRNNIYIAVLDPQTGRIVKPSYTSRELFSVGSLYLETTNPNWYHPEGFFKSIRPRTIDNLTRAEINYLKTIGTYPTPVTPRMGPARIDAISRILGGNNNDPVRAAAIDSVPTFANLFPYPPRNPDGSITGDVQNLKYSNSRQPNDYSNGRQANDSVWIDADLPLVTFKGRKLKPMPALAVIPMDGRVNYNVAGNVRNGGTTHASNQGFSPSEVNLGHIFETNPFVAPFTQSLITTRNDGVTVPNTQVASPRGTVVTTQQFHPNANPLAAAVPARATYPPSYAGIDFDGSGGEQPIYPSTNFNTTRTYPPATYATRPGSSELVNEITSPGSLFNPYQWAPLTISGGATAGFGNPYPYTDARALFARYSEKPIYANETHLGRNYPALAASQPVHPSNYTRALITPMSNRVARPGLAPNFFGPVNNNPAAGVFLAYTPGTGLVLEQAGTPVPGPVLSLAPGSPLTDPVAGHIGGDTVGAAQAILENQRAFLQGVNVNRPLADYRDPALDPGAGNPWPMNTTTITPASFLRAEIDRQTLARDIFHRLLMVCGAKVYIDRFPDGTPNVILPTVTGPGTYTLNVASVPPQSWPVSKPEYDAIRYLAQLSVNIVDYIDSDDIFTPFVWNPAVPGSDNPTNPDYAINFDPMNINERVVFGVEKPRLIVNETYAEVANAIVDEAGPSATADFEVRFFLELLNPGVAEDTRSALVGPDGLRPGSAPLIGTDITTATPYSVYEIDIYDNSTVVHNELHAGVPENVLGAISVPPRLRATFLNAVNAVDPELAQLVEPNNGEFASVTGVGRKGFAVVGPQLAPPAMGSTDPAYRPDPMVAPNEFLVTIPLDGGNPQNQLVYTLPNQLPGEIEPNTLNPLRANGHAVVLRRLACPYLPPSPTNPYVTVDAMTQIWVNDAIRVGRADGMTDGARPVTPTAPENHSQARMAPYLGFQPDLPVALDPTQPDPTVGSTYTITTRLANPPTTTPHLSFFRHNSQQVPFAGAGDLGLLHPFSAPTQLDRKLVNVAELLHLPTCKLHELPYRFGQPDASMTRPVLMHRQELVFAMYGSGSLAPPATPVPLYRLLEVLQTKPWNWGIPQGGRVPGGININMIWDADPTNATRSSRVFQAILDQQSSNRFTLPDVDLIWSNLRQNRTINWDPLTTPLNPLTIGATTHETTLAGTPGPGTDRPFHGFGVATLQRNGALSYGAYDSGIQATLLRQTLPPPADPTLQRPVFSTAIFNADPWEGLEPLRKAFGQITTTSDTYLVIMTIGFFEVIEDVDGRVLVRREAFDQVPGDLRQQFTTIIDRSNIARPATPLDGTTGVPWYTELVQPPVEIAPPSATVRPWYLKFKANGQVGNDILLHYEDQLRINNEPIRLTVGSRIRIGNGPNAEIVTISGLGSGLGAVPPAPGPSFPPFDPATGFATVTIDRAATDPLRFIHHAGESVTGEFIPGHPGSVAFDINNPQFRGVVRFFSRLRP